MAQHTHFLVRLGRVDEEERELALKLYFDPALLSHVLSIVPLPDGWDRIAISLGDLQQGPFVIVARNGAFVTCLGRGMRSKHLVISRERYDAARKSYARKRERVAA